MHYRDIHNDLNENGEFFMTLENIKCFIKKSCYEPFESFKNEKFQTFITVAINEFIINFHVIFSRKKPGSISNRLFFQCISLFPNLFDFD